MSAAAPDFHAKYRAHRAHMALVPLAIENVGARLIDFNGQPMADNEVPRDGITCGELRVLLAEVARLAAQVKQQQADASEAQREFSREARDIAAEARWEERQSRDGDYGSY